MAEAGFVIPGDPETKTGGYGYDRRVMALLPAAGKAVRAIRLSGSYPFPSADDLASDAANLTAQHVDALLIDGLAYGAMPATMVAGLKQPIVALVHHPLFLEPGSSEEMRARLFDSEGAALRYAAGVVVTSAHTAELVQQHFKVSADRITVAEPGTDPALRARGTGQPLQLLAVGAVAPRKAYDLLIRALRPLHALEWRLTIVGLTDRAPQFVEEVRQEIAASGFSDRITLAGAVEDTRLEALYAAADLFVMASLFEGYGMVLGEALARGLPIVCTTGGASVATAPDAAALKVPPGDEAAMTAALGQAIGDAGLRRRLGEASWAAGQYLPRWEDTARKVAAALQRALR